MKDVIRFLVLSAMALGVQGPTTAQETVDVGDSTAPWLGFMNVNELPANGGGFVFGSPWGVADLVATFDDPNNELVLTPNTIGDPDPFWYVGGGGPGAPGNKQMEANLYQEVTGGYAGKTVTFNYNVSADTSTAAHSGFAFIKDFAPDFSSSIDMVVPLAVGAGQSISLATINDPARHVQWGFQLIGENVWVTDVAPFGGITIDTVTTPPPPSFGSYFQQFDGLTAADPSALDLDGWKVFGAVFDSGGAFKFSYGEFPAPNGGPAFSAIASGEGAGGPADQYLNAYSDYNCCDPGGTNEGHFDPSGLETVRSALFQDRTITTTDIGREVEFNFDIKLPSDPNVALGGSSTASVFIRTIDAGGGISNEVIQDVTTIPGLNDMTWINHSLTFTIPSGVAGQTFQWGIESNSSDFEPTGVYLDNVSLDDFAVPGDFDGDGDVDNDDLTDPVDGWETRFGVDLDGSDFLTWQSQFGVGVPLLSAGIATVPEPTTVGLMVLSGICLLSCQTRKRYRIS